MNLNCIRNNWNVQIEALEFLHAVMLHCFLVFVNVYILYLHLFLGLVDVLMDHLVG